MDDTEFFELIQRGGSEFKKNDVYLFLGSTMNATEIITKYDHFTQISEYINDEVSFVEKTLAGLDCNKTINLFIEADNHNRHVYFLEFLEKSEWKSVYKGPIEFCNLKPKFRVILFKFVKNVLVLIK